MFEFTDFTHANLEACAEAYAGLAPGPSPRETLARDLPREILNPVGASLLAIFGFGAAPLLIGKAKAH